MKPQRSPAEKKALAYEKDHINVGEYPHGFRHDWPRKKAHAQRAYRRKIRQVLDEVARGPATENLADPSTDTVRRKRIIKWQPQTLRQSLQWRRKMRVQRDLRRNFFRFPYQSTPDRTRFATFLAAQITSHTVHARELAGTLEELLSYDVQPVLPGGERPWGSFSDRQWLREFLQDAPEWEAKLREWITSFQDVVGDQ